MDVVTGRGAGPRTMLRSKAQSILIDFTTTNHYGNTPRDRCAWWSDAIYEAASMNNSTNRGSFPPVSYHRLFMATLTCGNIGQDAQRLIRALAEAKIHEYGYLEDEEGQNTYTGR